MFKNPFKSLFATPKQKSFEETALEQHNEGNSKTSLKIWNQDSPVCPYCNTPLNEWPQRKKKCPNCKQDIFIKKNPKNNNWEIVTKQRLEEWEAAWEEKYFENRWLRELEQFEITRSDLERLKSLNKLPSRDCIWSLCNQALLKYAGDHHKSSMLYFKMAYFVLEEGKDPTYLVQLCREMEIQEIERAIANSDYLSSQLQICSKSHESVNCTNCEFLNGRILDIEEARSTKPIPHNNCNRQFCLAFYQSVIKTDSIINETMNNS
jgi:hypothetical protein